MLVPKITAIAALLIASVYLYGGSFGYAAIFFIAAFAVFFISDIILKNSRTYTRNSKYHHRDLSRSTHFPKDKIDVVILDEEILP